MFRRGLLKIFLVLLTPWTMAAGQGILAAPVVNPDKMLISLPDGPVEVTPGTRIEYLEDRGGEFYLDRVLGRAGRGFRPSRMRRPGFGQTKSAYWLRLRIRNEAPRRRAYFLQVEFPRLDRIEFYKLNESGGAVVRRAGDARAFAERPTLHPDFVFRIEPEPGEIVQIYMRVESDGVTQIPLVIRDARVFAARSETRKLVLGVYYGILLVMAVYNLALFLAIRDTAYIYYAFCIAGFSLYQFTSNGLAYEYLWPESPNWNNRALPFFTTCACIGAILFSMRFLNTRRFVPRLNSVFRLIAAAAVLTAVFSLSPYYVPASNMIRLLALSFIALVIYAAVHSLRRGFRPAAFYLIAWSGYLLGIVLFVLQLRGWIASNAVTESGMQIGSALEVVLLSLGLTDRIQTLRKQKDAAHLQASRNRRLAIRRLREADKIKDEFVHQLEIQVKERTSELSSALKSLRERDEIIRMELELATEIQKSILPDPETPPEKFHWAVHYQAMGEVGGDFYDIIPLPEGGFAFVMADASGHGIPAALMTMIAKISFAEAVRMNDSPADVLNYVRRNFLDNVRLPGHYVTAFLAHVRSDGMVHYSNAGHLAQFVLRKDKGEIESLDIPGFILGGIDIEIAPYRNGEVRLNPGDRLFLYTDGITEAADENHRDYGEEQLRKIAAATLSVSVEEARDAILRDWRAYAARGKRNDDVTLVILEAPGEF